jgi:hypothetical protein
MVFQEKALAGRYPIRNWLGYLYTEPDLDKSCYGSAYINISTAELRVVAKINGEKQWVEVATIIGTDNELKNGEFDIDTLQDLPKRDTFYTTNVVGNWTASMSGDMIHELTGHTIDQFTDKDNDLRVMPSGAEGETHYVQTLTLFYNAPNSQPNETYVLRRQGNETSTDYHWNSWTLVSKALQPVADGTTTTIGTTASGVTTYSLRSDS